MLGVLMTTLVKTPNDTWQARVRLEGWPPVSKVFRVKRDAEDWGRNTEDEMVRGVYVTRSPSERMLFLAALERYLEEISPDKRPNTERSEHRSAVDLKRFFGQYSLASISADLVCQYQDDRLAAAARTTRYGSTFPALSDKRC